MGAQVPAAALEASEESHGNDTDTSAGGIEERAGGCGSASSSLVGGVGAGGAGAGGAGTGEYSKPFYHMGDCPKLPFTRQVSIH
jgi:hypothetical protein